ncbi:MAG: hypothetical protein SWO11_17025 [Thermodesulfobacteriota bacterium]|nr:hypothetical protein [Thermodesulfobacteriota bacterium]
MRKSLFKDVIIDLYQEKAVNARVAVEVIPRKMNNGKEESFADWVRRGVAETQQNKLGRTEGISILAGRWLRPCSSCGSMPAEKKIKENRQHYLCHACFLKREQVNRLYRDIKPGESHFRTLKPVDALERNYTNEFIFATLSEINSGCEVSLPQDFDDIGQYS